MSSQQEQNKGEMPVAEGVRLTDLVIYQDGSVVTSFALNVRRSTRSTDISYATSTT
jgi:hypothetical protein